MLTDLLQQIWLVIRHGLAITTWVVVAALVVLWMAMLWEALAHNSAEAFTACLLGWLVPLLLFQIGLTIWHGGLADVRCTCPMVCGANECHRICVDCVRTWPDGTVEIVPEIKATSR